jgi:hypothetical protein
MKYGTKIIYSIKEYDYKILNLFKELSYGAMLSMNGLCVTDVFPFLKFKWSIQ